MRRSSEYVSVERLEAILREGLLKGYARMVPWSDLPGDHRRRGELLLQMDCEQPFAREFSGRYSRQDGKPAEVLTVVVWMRCRQCTSCMRARARMWMARAMDEFAAWPRTMMGTVTMSVQHHYELDARAMVRLGAQAVSWSSLSEDERFKERVREYNIELTRLFKRWRKGDGRHRSPAFRYLLIAERHDSEQTSVELRGRPHFHLIIHECEVGSLVYGDPAEAVTLERRSGEWVHRWRKVRNEWRKFAFVADDAFLRQKWTLGHTVFEWAETAQAAVYVCKYLTKDMDARVRASIRYGDPGGAGQGVEDSRETSIPTASLSSRRETRSAEQLDAATRIRYEERQHRLREHWDAVERMRTDGKGS